MKAAAEAMQFELKFVSLDRAKLYYTYFVKDNESGKNTSGRGGFANGFY